MSTILITGGTGLIGTALSKYLVARGHEVIILTRSIKEKVPEAGIEYALWNVEKQEIDIAAVQKADYIMHLAGAGVVDKRWTAKYKKEILESRTQSSKLLVETLRQNPHKVRALISSSAMGWYGEDKKSGFAFTETDPPDEGFLGQTCMLWERSVEEAETIGIRVCKLRQGIVLSNDGGALEAFKRPIRFGVAAILGSGKQMISWIHIDDLCRLFFFAMQNENIAGSYNAVALRPENNKTFTLLLAKLIRGNFFLPMHIPTYLLKLILGTRSIEVLKSTTVSCSKIKNNGFTFLYPTLEAALGELTRKKIVKDPHG